MRAAALFLCLSVGSANVRAGVCSSTAKAANSCDSALRHYLETAGPEDAQRRVWARGGEQQRRMRFALSELIANVEGRGRSIIDKADNVVNLAVELGVVDKKVHAGSEGAGSSVFVKDVGYTVGVTPEPTTASAMASVISAALDFRQSVVDFAEDLSRRCETRNLMSKHGIESSVKSDFCVSGKKRKAVTAPLEFDAALRYLTDPSIKSVNDASKCRGVALSRFDYRLCNLLATRAEAVAIAANAAKKSEDDLAPTELSRIRSTPEYGELEDAVKAAGGE